MTPGREKQSIAKSAELFFNDNSEQLFNFLKQTEDFGPRFPENVAGFDENVAGFPEKVAGFVLRLQIISYLCSKIAI